jgi:hypothetical protein
VVDRNMESDQFPTLYSGSLSFSQPPAQKRLLTEGLLPAGAKRQRCPTQRFDPIEVYGLEHMAALEDGSGESVSDPHDTQDDSRADSQADSYNSQEESAGSDEDDSEDEAEEEEKEEDEDSEEDEEYDGPTDEAESEEEAECDTDDILPVGAKRQRRPPQRFDPMEVYGPEHMATLDEGSGESVSDPHDSEDDSQDDSQADSQADSQTTTQTTATTTKKRARAVARMTTKTKMLTFAC